MTVTTNVKQMKLNVVTQQQYDSMTKNANELYAVTDASISYKELSDKPAVTSLPTASVSNEGDIYQYVGVTDQYYTHGYFYECVSDGAVSPTYSWEQLDVQPAGSSLPSQTGNAGKFLTTDGTDASWGTTINGAYKSVITLSPYTEIFTATDSSNRSKFEISYSSTAFSGSIVFRDSDASYKSGLSFFNNGSTKTITPITTNWELGVSNNKWANVYTTKINNGADITVPNQAGTMVVADPTSATQGQVLTLDSNLKPTWANASGSIPTLTWYTVSTAGNTLTIADTSSAQLVKIYKNGLLLEPTADYSISGTTLTMVTALVVGDKITTEVF